ncbi:MAG: hypothetical protein QXR72_13925 [Saccharolobus sp.]|uniref:hypothetical protein n=1 Tax=Saccharolobus sp. TaxID=2100761 RepID=UPI003179653D
MDKAQRLNLLLGYTVRVWLKIDKHVNLARVRAIPQLLDNPSDWVYVGYLDLLGDVSEREFSLIRVRNIRKYWEKVHKQVKTIEDCAIVLSLALETLPSNIIHASAKIGEYLDQKDYCSARATFAHEILRELRTVALSIYKLYDTYFELKSNAYCAVKKYKLDILEQDDIIGNCKLLFQYIRSFLYDVPNELYSDIYWFDIPNWDS